MYDGAEVIYQAAFVDVGGCVGLADFLVRGQGPSDLGDHSYEAYDTKLAKYPKPYFILQLAFYTEQIAGLQGWMPREMHVVLGDGQTKSFVYADFGAYVGLARFCGDGGPGLHATISVSGGPLLLVSLVAALRRQAPRRRPPQPRGRSGACARTQARDWRIAQPMGLIDLNGTIIAPRLTPRRREAECPRSRTSTSVCGRTRMHGSM